MERTPGKLPMVRVTWEDSCSHEGWLKENEAKEYAEDGSLKVYSVGYLYQETVEVITLVGSDTEEQVLGMLNIPKGCVLAVDYLAVQRYSPTGLYPNPQDFGNAVIDQEAFLKDGDNHAGQTGKKLEDVPPAPKEGIQQKEGREDNERQREEAEIMQLARESAERRLQANLCGLPRRLCNDPKV